VLRPHAISFVSNVDELYAAVDLANNPKPRLVLAPSTYTLSAAQSNQRLLELHPNVPLCAGESSAFVIDASQLPTPSFKDPRPAAATM